jgi:hypothetical protein
VPRRTRGGVLLYQNTALAAGNRIFEGQITPKFANSGEILPNRRLLKKSAVLLLDGENSHA